MGLPVDGTTNTNIIVIAWFKYTGQRQLNFEEVILT